MRYSCDAGVNVWTEPADLHISAVPPPAYTWNPRSPPGPIAALNARSLIAIAVWSSRHPSNAILNLRGRLELSRWRRRNLVSASAYGVTSNSSSADVPAYGHAVMLRTELPQASRVVMPTSARRRIAGS